MDGISLASSLARRQDVVLPLVLCNRCKCRTVIALRAGTPKNEGRFFYICPTYQRDGSGCDFWYWEEKYEDFFIKKKLVPPNYRRVFSVKQERHVQRDVAHAEASDLKGDDDRLMEKMDLVLGLVREIVVVLKVLVGVAVCTLLVN
ncbi:hypothetical protein U9M48_009340, partial [Paspalum notatum var. saurae]